MVEEISIRNVLPADVSAVCRFVSDCPPLTLHTRVTYAVLFRHFPELCFIAESKGKLVGFASALRGTSHNDAVYCWQLGVVVGYRGTGLALRLVEARIEAACKLGCRRVQVGIEAGNQKSLRLWSKCAAKFGRQLRHVGELSFSDKLSGGSDSDIVWELVL